MIRLYDYFESGNAYKVRLLLTQLGIPFERVEVDILAGATRRPEFLAKNPNHRVPLVEWPDGRRLAESNAILFHLAEGTPYLPEDPFERAQVLQWLFFEQYSHEPYIAVVRFWHFAGMLEDKRDQLAEKTERGYEALGVMENHPPRARGFRRRPLHDRGRRALRLHPRRPRGRLRARSFPGGPGVAREGGRAAGARGDRRGDRYAGGVAVIARAA